MKILLYIIPLMLLPHLGTAQKCGIENLHLDSLNKLNWTVKKAAINSSFVIKQFVWNRWIPIGACGGSLASMFTGEKVGNYGRIDIPIHIGINKIVIIGNDKNTCSSDTLEFQSTVASKETLKTTRTIFLLDSSDYKVFSTEGQLLLYGSEKQIDLKTLAVGMYYLQTPDKFSKFRKCANIVDCQ
jgi:hypothetical protein